MENARAPEAARPVSVPKLDHIREHRSLLAAAEKRLLVWIAERLPRWVTSDHLTLLGLCSILVAGLGFAGTRWTPWGMGVVVMALALNWFGDSLDGTLARVRHHLRPQYGFYVDHVVDVAGATFLLGGLGWSSYMSPLVAMAVLVGYLLVAAESFLATHTLGVFRLSFSGVGPTELRILLAVGSVYVLYKPWVTIHGLGTFRLFDVGGIVAVVGLAAAFVVSANRNTRALYRAEPPQRRTGAI